MAYTEGGVALLECVLDCPDQPCILVTHHHDILPRNGPSKLSHEPRLVVLILNADNAVGNRENAAFSIITYCSEQNP